MKKEGTPKEVVALKSLLNVIDSTQQPEKFDTRFIIAVETAAAVAESISGKKIEGEIKLDLKSAIEKFKKVVSVMFEDVLKGIEDLDIDEWAKKMGRSRSRFIVEEIEKRLRKLEDDEITKLYNEAYSDPERVSYDIQLAEEMLDMCSIHEEEEKW